MGYRVGRPRKARVHILKMPTVAHDRTAEQQFAKAAPMVNRKTGLDRGYRKVYCGNGSWKRVGWKPPLASKPPPNTLTGCVPLSAQSDVFKSNHSYDKPRGPLVPRSWRRGSK